MAETEESVVYRIPTEILTHIFSLIKPISLVRCRQVCVRWRWVVDGLLDNDDLWQNHCKEDFNEIYQDAYDKSKSKLRWFDVYMTLSLWSRLDEAVVSIDEFACASSSSDEIRNFQVPRDAIIGVHSRKEVSYYDLNTMQPMQSRSSTVKGEYLRYMENESNILILGKNLNLFVIRKYGMKSFAIKANVVFHCVKAFILLNKDIYFVTINDVVYRCDLRKDELHCKEVTQMANTVTSIGYSTQLNILTFERKVYSIHGRKKQLQCTIEPSNNMLHILRKYNLLDHLDWRMYLQWMQNLNHPIPQGPLRDIIIIKTYGKAVFVGSNFGVLRIYYAPYVNEEFDIFNSNYIKQYNFMERSDCPVLSVCPIKQIDVVEDCGIHVVLIAMPKKIVAIKFSHDFYRNEFPTFPEDVN